jgi:4-nitrophenyl phosphatase
MIEKPIKSHLPAVKAAILDMDGVLWRGLEPIGDLPFIFSRIASLGWQVAFATNNTTRTVSQYVEVLREFGVAVDPEQIVTSGVASGNYLKRKYDGGSEIFIIGEQALLDTLAAFGFNPGEYAPKAVVVGLDRQLTFGRLAVASRFIRSGCEFIGTNPDPTLPTPDGLIPGTGSILAALRTSTGVEPTIIGKPYPELFRIALDRLGTTPEETLVIGDQIETDIAGGIAAGCLTALVLTGVTTAEVAAASQFNPTFIAANIESLLKHFL